MNDIIEEVREAKRRVNARFDNDIHKYCVDVRHRQEQLKKQGIKFLRLNVNKKKDSASTETTKLEA